MASNLAKCRSELAGYREYIGRLKLEAEFDYIYKSNIDYFIRKPSLQSEYLTTAGTMSFVNIIK